MSTLTSREPVPFTDLPAAERARIVDAMLAPAAERARRYEEWLRSPVAKRYTGEDSARRGQEIYDRLVRPILNPADDGKFVVVDLETEAFEMDDDEYAAGDRLTARVPAFQTWTGRVGYVAIMTCRLSWNRA